MTIGSLPVVRFTSVCELRKYDACLLATSRGRETEIAKQTMFC